MKEKNSKLSLGKISWLFGVSRQAYYQSINCEIITQMEQELIVKEVLHHRRSHPRMGTRKILIKLQDFIELHNIKMGRDALYDLLSVNNLLIRKRKRGVRTTQSHHWLKKYPNLIREFVPTAPNMLYVSDITYWKINEYFVYISLITDAYSHKIVGYNVAETLETLECVKALNMALSNLPENANLIHHSDRGVQYCSDMYVSKLKERNIKISMTENGDPLENAIAERINGILKGEYLECYTISNITEAKELLDTVVKLYNEDRPHMSIGNFTPITVHNNINKAGERKWKNYYPKKQPVNQF
jgi:transposase InsO family protein